MATLSANKKRNYDLGVDLKPVDYDCSVDIIYEGAAVSYVDASEGAKPQNSSDAFVGFAMRKVDNSGGSIGDKKVRVAQQGILRGLTVAGVVTTTAPGTAVYASDDDTFTLTSSSAHEQIGKVVRCETAGVADVYFEGLGVRSV